MTSVGTKAMIRVDFKQLRHDEDGRMLLGGHFFTGIAVEYWRGGAIASEMSYQDGIEDGLSRGWHDNGVRSWVTPYRKGCVAGMMQEWHRNGQLALQEEIDHGVALWRRRWNENGDMVEDYNYVNSPHYAWLENHRNIGRDRADP